MRDSQLYRRSTIKCLRCGTDTTNPRFCSVSCAATHNNTSRPKRPVQLTKRALYGDNWQIGHITIGELKARYKGTWRRVINGNARVMHAKFGMPKTCHKCEYTKMYDVCHKKPVSTFSDNSALNEVNAKDNLLTFCKNHHWEFDNNVLD